MLRRTEPKDLGTIYGMLCELEGSALPFEAFKEVFLRNIADPYNYYMVGLDENGQVAGHFAMHTQWLLHHAGRVAEIQEMYVLPAQRGMALGEAMIRDGIRWAREQGCVLVEVTANNKRERTHRFYERIGMQHTHKKFTLMLQQDR